VRRFLAAGRDRGRAKPGRREAGRRWHRGFHARHLKPGPADAPVSHDHERFDLPGDTARDLPHADAGILVLAACLLVLAAGRFVLAAARHAL
jgi:hypothetical protein